MAFVSVCSVSLHGDHAEDNEVLISRRTWGEVQYEAVAKPAGSLELKGFSHPVEAYLLEGLR